MLITAFKKIDRIFLQIEEWSLFISVAAALLIAMANVILRKATSDLSLYWSDEVVRKTIFFTTYIGCVAAIRSRSLIRIDALPQILPILRKPLLLLSHLAVLVFSALMVVLGLSMTQMMYADEYARTTTLQIPEFIFYAVLPVMGVMMFLRTLIALREDWSGVRDITGD
jgi:TRAP-type C4-dicarboxylate transport system permease small subunit